MSKFNIRKIQPQKENPAFSGSSKLKTFQRTKCTVTQKSNQLNPTKAVLVTNNIALARYQNLIWGYNKIFLIFPPSESLQL